MEFIINNLDELPEVAQKIIDQLQYKLITFEGEMGAGKTTFIKEFVKALGTNDEVSSPTFSIVNEYETDKGKVYHFDFYRLNHEDEALDFGIEEYLYSNQYCLMEWPNKIANFIPDEHHTITLENVDGVRHLNFS
ncbi:MULTISPECIES: tRNA (adenosine(37)-N6)-threonylcarbamoyltransferase complex ATPase subunit type 1 TsaE [Empedobacter]|uniref:tRNA threonylcarbamoyladenosine biosynthesis protein TsaE n=1 Tax=Empedobacter falsenii TaxID=343874 RepID=A0A376GGM4_9FLAO|nr:MULTISPECIES: tRNA (adenosine(37)-N6)-threonylcarbamoyltransferase complex ATPase subunit type 1 TsaE [Empedobacter]MDH0659254.1 tRNA (adenosine(37)-N6)-threonylcarbamoyltransferase complex ATPase subunit type 1 TsaE [Empedobacter sp. GD03865]MDH1602055.1 tRNA (adenosine(37)-N6)-threonylcarbamoyltransferase complex ATPase subunit type 1 TsaE [Empedobacter sp. GD03739]MDM1041918.1 tRNA (adenosine(37)-N6)-threonylcarbamoyltransferase complex ATPase subunit type 1 TsaE [Empedobacter brevis]MDM1